MQKRFYLSSKLFISGSLVASRGKIHSLSKDTHSGTLLKCLFCGRITILINGSLYHALWELLMPLQSLTCYWGFLEQERERKQGTGTWCCVDVAPAPLPPRGDGLCSLGCRAGAAPQVLLCLGTPTPLQACPAPAGGFSWLRKRIFLFCFTTWGSRAKATGELEFGCCTGRS